MCALNRLTRHTRSVSGLLAAGVIALALTTAAHAQPSLLPPNIVTATSLSSDDLSAINKAIKPHVDALSGPADKLSDARKQLLSPLVAANNPSVPFRLRYAEELSKALTPALSGTNQMAKINALVIAGELGTADAARLVNAARKDADPSVRFQAADASRGILTTYVNSRGGTLLGDDDARSFVNETAKAFAGEKDPLVLDALLGALETALANAKLQDVAAKGLADGANGIARTAAASAADLRLLEGLQRVCNTAVDLLNRQGQSMSAPARSSIADFAASCLWHIRQAINGKAVPAGAGGATLRESYARLAGSCENIIILTATSLAPTTKFTPKGLEANLKQGNNQGDAAFMASANELIAAVTAQPFVGIQATRYK